jgi:SAM-dependent methyltransferase
MGGNGAREKPMRILDIGCGTAKTEGAIGVDIAPLSGVDVIVNASKFPYPFADDSFDAVYVLDVIEHLPDTVGVMEEIYRISRPDARVFIRVVNWNHRYSAMDPTHVGLFTEHSFDFFGERVNRSYYTRARFSVEGVEYIFDAKARRWIRSRYIMKLLSNYLCNILQGLRFELRVLK